MHTTQFFPNFEWQTGTRVNRHPSCDARKARNGAFCRSYFLQILVIVSMLDKPSRDSVARLLLRVGKPDFRLIKTWTLLLVTGKLKALLGMFVAHKGPRYSHILIVLHVSFICFRWFGFGHVQFRPLPFVISFCLHMCVNLPSFLTFQYFVANFFCVS